MSLASTKLVFRKPSFWERVRSLTLGPYNLKDPTLAKFLSTWGNDDVSETAGVRVTDLTAFMFSVVFDAVRTGSSDVAMLPLNLHKRRKDGGSDEFVESKLYWLLKYQPNPEMGSMVFRRQMQAWAMCKHGAFAEIERDGLRRPTALWPINPDRVTVGRTRAGDLAYRVSNPDGGEVVLSASDVIHINGLGDDPHDAYPVIGLARRAIGLALAAEQFGASFFGNGSTMSGVLSAKLPMPDKKQRDALRQDIEAFHKGAKNAHRLLVLGSDFAYHRLGVAPNESQMHELREEQVREIARFFNMPLFKLKSADPGSSYASLEVMRLDYYTGFVQHWIKLWEEELTRKLIAPSEIRQQFIKHNAEAFLRGDTAARVAYYQAMRNLGVMSANEIRSKEDMNPIGPQGDLYLMQQGFAPLDLIKPLAEANIKQAEQPPEPPPTPPSDDAASEANARAERAEQVARDAEARAAELRDRVTALEATGTADKVEIDRLRQAEHVAIQTAAKSHQTAEDLRAQAAALTAERDAATAAREAAILAERAALDRLAETTEARDRAHAEAATAIATAETLRTAADAAATTLAGLESQLSDATSGRADLEAAIEAERQKAGAAELRALEAELARNGLADAAMLAAERETQAREAADAARVALVALTEERNQALTAKGAAEATAADAAAARMAAELAAEIAQARAAGATEAEAVARSVMETVQRERDAALTAKGAADALRLEADERARAAEAQRAIAEATAEQARQALADADTAIAQHAERVRTLETTEAERARLAEAKAQLEADLTRANEVLTAAKAAEADAEQLLNDAQTAQHEAEARAASLARADHDGVGAEIAAHRALIVHVMRGAIERETDRARRNQQTPEKLRAWMGSWYDSHAELMTAALLPAVSVHLAWMRSTETPGDVVRQLVHEHIAESKRQLEAVVDGDADALARNLAHLLSRWDAERVTVLADRLMEQEIQYAQRRTAA